MKNTSQTPQTFQTFESWILNPESKVSLNPQPSTLNLVLTRTRPQGEYVHGHLFIDGLQICSTLENSNAQAPAGDYPITLIKCKQHARKMPCLNPNPPCTQCKKSLNSNPSSLNHTLPCWCPMIKPGNGVHNRLDGSIIIGVYNCLGSIIHPKASFDALYERIRKSISRGHQVILTIKNG